MGVAITPSQEEGPENKMDSGIQGPQHHHCEEILPISIPRRHCLHHIIISHLFWTASKYTYPCQ